MKPKAKPIHIAKIGSVRVRVARNGPGRFCVHWREYTGAPPRREHFRDRPAAIARADELARAIADGLADVVTLTSADRDHYRRAVLALEPLGIPLPVAIAEYTAAKRQIPDHTLHEAVTFFLRGHAERLDCPPTAQVVEELLADIADNRRSAKYRDQLARDLNRFATAFPDLREVTHTALKAHLASLTVPSGPRRGQPVGLRRRDNVRDAIVLLFRFARRPRDGRHHGYLPDRLSIAEQIPKLAAGGNVTTYTAAEVEAILHHFASTDREFLPWAAIAAFAGLRTEEIFRLDWSAVSWETGTIAVSASIALKIRISRRAPLLPNLAAWIAEGRNCTGPLIQPRGKNIANCHKHALARLRRALGWPAWKTNALRHSFGSNRLAIVKSMAQVALEMGNSPRQVREHYNDSTTAAAATHYFALAPAAPANIVRLSTAPAGS